MDIIAGGLAILAVGAGFAGYIYTAYRVSREPAFSPQIRQLGFWAVLFVPALALAYWAWKWTTRQPLLEPRGSQHRDAGSR